MHVLYYPFLFSKREEMADKYLHGEPKSEGDLSEYFMNEMTDSCILALLSKTCLL